MKKNLYYGLPPALRWKKVMIFAALNLLLLFCGAESLSAGSNFLQQKKLNVSYRNEPITSVIESLKTEAGVQFFYQKNIFPATQRVTLTMNDASLEAILDKLLVENGYTYHLEDDVIVIRPRPESASQPARQDPVNITGTVTDEKGAPVVGAGIYLKNDPRKGTLADEKGNFSITVPANSVLVISYIGMAVQEVPVTTGRSVYNVTLEGTATEIEEVSVVSTGIFVRDRATFTGTAPTYSGDELRMFSSGSVLQSLKLVDPSFQIVDNLEMGSNPNTMPTIELRGQSSPTLSTIQDEFSSDPNLPLFVLNGLEVSVSRINDLDMNRVASITILKDAGSTAIWGSKGANGVVVIETIKPKPGEFRITYSGGLDVSAPDLSVYNMMNASEKLEFDRLWGKFSTADVHNYDSYDLYYLQQLYMGLKKDIESGVDTYWLSEPVRTGITHSHSLSILGGNEELSVSVGALYKNQQGTMKGSDRQTWSGDIGLDYRLKKLLISNRLEVSGFVGNESPYGSFDTWINAVPYYRKYNEEGGIDKYLLTRDGIASMRPNLIGNVNSPFMDVVNPLYNAMLDSKNRTDGLNISNNLLIQYDITDNMRVSGGFQIGRNQSRTVQFTPSEHTKYDKRPSSEKGEYRKTDIFAWFYKTYLTAVYHNVWNRHSFTGQVNGQILQNTSNLTYTEATGFTAGSSGAPNTAATYKAEAKPGYSNRVTREVSAKAVLNYNYDRRYLLDLTASLDGTTNFGSNKLFQPFFSVGVGWNIHNEQFMKSAPWAEIMKIYASFGTNGNQNLGQVYSQSVFYTMLYNNVFGEGLKMSKLGSPDVPWSVIDKWEFGLNFRTMQGRLSLDLMGYMNDHDPLVINVTQVPSTGLDKYPMFLGRMKKNGFEWNLRFSPVYNLEKRIMWTIGFTGDHYNSKYSGFGEALAGVNKELIDAKVLQQFADGAHPYDIWAVKSNGVDPATGREVFVRKDGSLSYDYSVDDLAVVGSSRPDFAGSINTTFRYGNFDFTIAFTYRLGASLYNYALFNKVENIDYRKLNNNQDKRALHGRWKEPGEKAKFIAIGIASRNNTLESSRFVQKDNYLRGDNIRIGYEFTDGWIRSAGLSRLKIEAYGNDLFRWETSKTERGTSYPFARTFSMKLTLGF